MTAPTDIAPPQNCPAVSGSDHRLVLACGVTVYLGDCRDVLGTMEADAIITDPPYGIGFAGQPTRYQRANGMKAKRWDDETPADVIETLLETRLPMVVWGGNYFALPPSRGWLAWSKRGNAPSMADLELAWTNRDMNARSFEKTVKSASLEKCLQTSPHPSQKPVALMAWSMDMMAIPEGATVLDPFMGSGSTIIAAIRTGRKAIGIEKDPEYFKNAVERIKRELAQGDLFHSQNESSSASLRGEYAR